MNGSIKSTSYILFGNTGSYFGVYSAQPLLCIEFVLQHSDCHPDFTLTTPSLPLEGGERLALLWCLQACDREGSIVILATIVVTYELFEDE